MKSLFLIVVFCLFSTPATILACSCVFSDPAQEFGRAKLIFIGRMLGGTEKVESQGRSGKTTTLEAGDVRFSVEELFKGELAQEVTLSVASGRNTSCAYGMVRGARYVVYAYSGDKEGMLYTGICTRTNTVDNKYAEPDLKFLRHLPPPGIGGEIDGFITVDLKDNARHPLGDIRIKVTDAEGQLITAFTDENGKFNVKQLKPGKYKVEPDFPASYATKQEFIEVEIADRGKAYAFFGAHIDARVSGRVIDADGNSFNSASLKMIAGKKTIYGHSSGTDGIFKVEGAPPDEYLIYIEMEGNHYSNRRLYYYPGTFEREKAEVIRVGLGEKIEGLVFRLPPSYLVRTIEGEVRWMDGTPAANVEVALLCPASTDPKGFRLHLRPPDTKTDGQGRFRLEGVTGETYWLEARGTRAGKKEGEEVEMHSPARKISLNESIKGVKIVLSKAGYFGGCPD